MTDSKKSEHQYGASGGNGMLWLAGTALLIGMLVVLLREKTADVPIEGSDGQLAASLTIYCAAGVRPPVEEAAKQFEK